MGLSTFRLAAGFSSIGELAHILLSANKMIYLANDSASSECVMFEDGGTPVFYDGDYAYFIFPQRKEVYMTDYYLSHMPFFDLMLLMTPTAPNGWRPN